MKFEKYYENEPKFTNLCDSIPWAKFIINSFFETADKAFCNLVHPSAGGV